VTVRLKHICKTDWLGVVGDCRACGSPVSEYASNEDLKRVRPEADAEGWDWWVACDNEDCKNHYGEGQFQNDIEWMIERPQP